MYGWSESPGDVSATQTGVSACLQCDCSYYSLVNNYGRYTQNIFDRYVRVSACVSAASLHCGCPRNSPLESAHFFLRGQSAHAFATGRSGWMHLLLVALCGDASATNYGKESEQHQRSTRGSQRTARQSPCSAQAGSSASSALTEASSTAAPCAGARRCVRGRGGRAREANGADSDRATNMA